MFNSYVQVLEDTPRKAMISNVHLTDQVTPSLLIVLEPAPKTHAELTHVDLPIEKKNVFFFFILYPLVNKHRTWSFIVDLSIENCDCL